MNKAFACLLFLLAALIAGWEAYLVVGDMKPWVRMEEVPPGGSGIEDPDWDEDPYCPPPPPPDE